jgi:folylpolyglutamate synthase/dihydropteroate synthase
MADKDVDGIVGALLAARVLRRATIVTTAVDLARALPAAALADRWRAQAAGQRVLVTPTPEAALDRAAATDAELVVVAGSLYLVGAVRALLVDDPLLRDPPVTG